MPVVEKTADALCTADAIYLTADGRLAVRADARVTADSIHVTADGWGSCGGGAVVSVSNWPIPVLRRRFR